MALNNPNPGTWKVRDISPRLITKADKLLFEIFSVMKKKRKKLCTWPDDVIDVCLCTPISVRMLHVHTTCMHLCSLQITVYDQDNFQGKRLEFTSACQNIMECGISNIRSLKVECGA